MTGRVQAAGRLLAGALALAAPGIAWAQSGPTGPNVTGMREQPGIAFVRTKMALFAYSGPDDTRFHVLDEVVGNTVLPTTGCTAGWCRIVLPRSAPVYIQQNLLEPVTPRR